MWIIGVNFPSQKVLNVSVYPVYDWQYFILFNNNGKNSLSLSSSKKNSSLLPPQLLFSFLHSKATDLLWTSFHPSYMKILSLNTSCWKSPSPFPFFFFHKLFVQLLELLFTWFPVSLLLTSVQCCLSSNSLSFLKYFVLPQTPCLSSSNTLSFPLFYFFYLVFLSVKHPLLAGYHPFSLLSLFPFPDHGIKNSKYWFPHSLDSYSYLGGPFLSTRIYPS